MKLLRSVKPFLAAVVMSAAILCWSVSMPQAVAAEPIGIGVLAPEGHILGKSIFNAAELAAAEINAKGGINGRQLKVFTYDTKSSSTDAARAFQRAAEQDHVVAMVGIFSSEVALAMMPWSARLKMPLIVTGAATDEIPKRIHAEPDRYKYVFHGYVNSAILATQACIVGKELLVDSKEFHYIRAVILSEDAAWTKPVDETYKKCLPEAGFEVVDHIRFSPDTTDFTPIYSRIKNAGADVIMAAMAHVGVKPVVQWHQQQVPALFSGINGQAGASEFWAATNGATEGVITGSPGVNGAALTEKTPEFYKAFTEKYGVTEPAYDAYTTYDAMYALRDAIERAGGTDSEKLVAELEKTDMTGVLGRITFHGLDHEWAHEVVFDQNPEKGQSFVGFQWQDGKQVIIWPKRLAEAEIKVPPFVPPPSK